jgi:3-methyladenine DNA glycosylase AlkD
MNKKICTVDDIQNSLREMAAFSPAAAERFFKTAPGSYAEQDQFLGVSVPSTRVVAKQYKDAPLSVVAQLLQSPFNQDRLCALFILVHQYPRNKKEIYDLYLNRIESVNNWNLVDASAHLIMGEYLWDKDRSLLYELAKSPNLWKRRIAIISTLNFIKRSEFADTFTIAQMLLHDDHDLIHKAVGWMLREVGKKDRGQLVSFLNKHAPAMPRTMLRYAIEHLSADEKKSFLQKK